MMRVIVRKAEEGVGRLCLIRNWCRAGEVDSQRDTTCTDDQGDIGQATPTMDSCRAIEAPMCMLYTIAGHLPHVTNDAAALASITSENAVYQLTLPTLLGSLQRLKAKDDEHDGIRGFVGLPESSLHYLSYNDPAVQIQPGNNDKNSVSMFGRAGRRRVDLPLFEDVQKSFKVHSFQSLADSDTQPDATGKRLQKAVDRTAKFAKKAVDVAAEVNANLFITLTGGHSEEHRMACIAEVAGLPCAGYVFEGFHSFGDLDDFQVSTISRLLTKCIGALPEDRLRIFPGALNPRQVVDLVRLGIDVFDSSYTYTLTEQFLALLVMRDLTKNEIYATVDLKSEKDCDCYTCKHYTKAYLNHLWTTQELLGPILLTVHNLHQYQQLFSNIRRLLSEELHCQRQLEAPC